MKHWISRANLRHHARHPIQSLLCIIGVALGVAVVLAIELAIGSAQVAFEESMDLTVGRATHRVVGGSRGLDERVYRDLRVLHGRRDVAPVVEGFVPSLIPAAPPWHLVGLDPLADGGLRPRVAAAMAKASGLEVPLLTQRHGVLVEAGAARRHGLAIGDSLVIRAAGIPQTLRIVATWAAEAGDSAADNLLLCDISTAQSLLQSLGRLSRIDVRLPRGALDTGLAELIRQVPASVRIEPAGAASGAQRQMVEAFHLNLFSLGLLALLVGAFLIYNTVTFSVVRRRQELARLRAIGATGGEIERLVLSDAALLGLAGTLLGLGLGYGLAEALVAAVTDTISDLYFVVSVRGTRWVPSALPKAIALGLGTTMAAAWRPAREASRIRPALAGSRSAFERSARIRAKRSAREGTLLALAGALALAVPTRSILFTHAALFALVLGVAATLPAFTGALARTATPLAARAGGVVGRLAVAGVSASLSRTGVAVAALAVAISMSTGVGVMVASFRSAVVTWLDSALHADAYVRAPGVVARRAAEIDLDPAVVHRVRNDPAVEEMHTNRAVTGRDAAGAPLDLVAIGWGPKHDPGLVFLDHDDAWTRLREPGSLALSEPLAFRRALDVGDSLTLDTDHGPAPFEVVGVFLDYASEQGYALFSLETYQTHFEDRGLTALGVFSPLPPDSLRSRLHQLTQGSAQLLDVISNRALHAASMNIFDRTFAITHVLRTLATVVAFVGILASLLALELERTWEYAVLRARGLSPRQLWGLIATQTSFLGVAAGLASIPLGAIMASVLTGIVNRRSFGWELELLLPPHLFLEGFAGAVLAAALAGIYPAWRIARVSPARALRSE